MSISATVMIPEPMPMFGPVQLAAAGLVRPGTTGLPSSTATWTAHRQLHIIGKGNRPALIPLPVPVARTLDLAAAERASGPLLRTRTGR